MYTVYTKQNSKLCEPLKYYPYSKKIMDILVLFFCEYSVISLTKHYLHIFIYTVAC